MAARKLQQEIDKEYKKIAEGIQAFDGIFEKLSSSQNASQREKLEDSLKKEYDSTTLEAACTDDWG